MTPNYHKQIITLMKKCKNLRRISKGENKLNSTLLRFLTASVNIYFKSSHFTRLKRYEIYGFSDFLSSTGGIFGLFLGCSVLSFIEIVYHLIAYCIRKVKKRRTELTISTSSNNPERPDA